MNLFGDFNWQYLIGGLAIGALVSICISLNIRVQNKFKSNKKLHSQIIQWLSYLSTVAVVGFAVANIAGEVLVGKNLTISEAIIFICGCTLPIVLAFKFGFIPRINR
ncbi:hypothetical protein [Solimicrobium silvestre]|uniref:Uncharacterized protein n=1 Tax=Solimicrobium silvestre TaxID=2099400 RepID=A0A2S9GSD9_9BURK|nr:hypothetical protein [Solimicrobium silvestre]PRC90608.1 hypothetical protein S2091_4676 [Solimicrobium silvestre]